MLHYASVLKLSYALGAKFKLPEEFIKEYKGKQPPFGFGVLGELVYRRTYSRVKDDGRNEQW